MGNDDNEIEAFSRFTGRMNTNQFHVSISLYKQEEVHHISHRISNTFAVLLSRSVLLQAFISQEPSAKQADKKKHKSDNQEEETM